MQSYSRVALPILRYLDRVSLTLKLDALALMICGSNFSCCPPWISNHF